MQAFRDNLDIDLASFVSSAVQLAAECGIIVQTRTDFATLAIISDALESKDPVSEPFDVRCMDLMPHSSFWICGTDRHGDVVHTQAMRRDDLGRLSLAEFWSQHFPRIHPTGQLGKDHCPASANITGLTAYHGEMWVRADMRRNGLAACLARLAQGLAFIRWQPEFIYGFVEARLVKSGFSLKEGYMHMQPRGVHWKVAPDNIRPDDWLLWNSVSDLAHLFAQPIEVYK